MIMRVRLALVLLIVLALLSLSDRAGIAHAQARASASASQSSEGDEGPRVQELLHRIELAARAASADDYLALLTPASDRTRAAEFAARFFKPGATRLVFAERERLKLTRGVNTAVAHRIIVDVFAEFGDEARVDTLQFDAEADPDTTNGWRIADQDSLSSVDKLFRLSVFRASQYDARDFVVSAEDLTLTLTEGTVFRIDTPDGPTGLVLMGQGELRFAPAPETERGQVRIFAGEPALTTRFETAYLRFRDIAPHADLSKLSPRPVDSRALRRAEQVFKEESAKSFILDLADLSRDAWSLLPGEGDFLAEIKTRRFGTLTYARSADEPEDIAFFERRRQRNISVYASAAKLKQRGRFYDEDALAAYDVLHYDVDLTLDPERQWLVGSTTIRLRVKRTVAAQLTLRLADSLVVRSIESDRFGRLFGLRSKGQNAILLSLPVSMMPESEIRLTIQYAGRLAPQGPDRETITVEQQDDTPAFGTALPDGASAARGEPNFVYSNMTYWYPQAQITDYATAVIHITVPSSYSVVASGTPQPKSPMFVTAIGSQPGKLFMFRAERPVRYLSFVASRFERTDTSALSFEPRSLPPSTIPPVNAGLGIQMVPQNQTPRPVPPPPVHSSLALAIEANPRQTSRSREHMERASDIVKFYDSVVGDIPYDSFTMALTEHVTPGGHSPGYFAILNQTLPSYGGVVTWRNDPAAFEGYPEFFLAHELAHQWWGQAVGWRNYHEQWLSEGFAQYFAAMYAGHQRGPQAMGPILRHMRKWAVETSSQGPVYLGYRLGHIRNEGRVHRALVYNKGGIVLHMLRRLLGDETFFAGLRRYYADWRYRKAGTESLREAMETVSGRSLETFFERWIYGSSLPTVTWSARVEPGANGSRLAVRVEQQQPDAFEFPLTLTLEYADRPAGTVTIPVWERITETTVPLAGTLRQVEVDRDEGLLAEMQRIP